MLRHILKSFQYSECLVHGAADSQIVNHLILNLALRIDQKQSAQGNATIGERDTAGACGACFSTAPIIYSGLWGCVSYICTPISFCGLFFAVEITAAVHGFF